MHRNSNPKNSVLVYFSTRNSDCYDASELTAVPRAASSPAVLRTALTELFEGPTRAERRRGLGSIFGPHSIDFLRRVAIDNGTATVDVRDLSLIPQVSTSCAGSHFVGSLTQTVFQFESIAQVRYLSRGSCRRFWRGLESTCGHASPISRDEW
ncbi:MAG: GerMN domain-containing protein [Actinomycetota bacterium]